MKRQHIAVTCCLAAIGLLMAATIQPARAALLHDESISGDLANFIEVNPWISAGSPLGTLSAGEHQVLGGYAGTALAGGGDSDVLTVEISAGHQLDAIDLVYDVTSGDVGNGSYYAIQEGSSLGTGISTVGANLSNALVNGSGDLLAMFAAGPAFGGVGFTAPLPAGVYTVGLHETSAAAVNYSLSFQVSAVPEPSTVTLLLAAGLTLGVGIGARTKSHSQRGRLRELE